MGGGNGGRRVSDGYGCKVGYMIRTLQDLRQQLSLSENHAPAGQVPLRGEGIS